MLGASPITESGKQVLATRTFVVFPVSEHLSATEHMQLLSDDRYQFTYLCVSNRGLPKDPTAEQILLFLCKFRFLFLASSFLVHYEQHVFRSSAQTFASTPRDLFRLSRCPIGRGGGFSSRSLWRQSVQPINMHIELEAVVFHAALLIQGCLG